MIQQNSDVFLFIRKSLDKYRKSNGTHPLKCKNCVAEQETKERALAAAKMQSLDNETFDSTNDENQASNPVECASCKKQLSSSFYNKSQLSKGEGKARCRSCVEEAIANEAKQLKGAREQKIEEAKERVRIATERGNIAAKVKAEAELSALEAETVTGLKPVVLGRGKIGRGFSSGRGGRLLGRSRRR